MTANPNPIELIGGITSTANVPKADIVAWAKARVIQVFADVTEVRNTTLAAQTAIFLRTFNSIFLFDATDTTTADDGITCIISSDGKRFKPFPLALNVGDLTRAAAIAAMIPAGINTIRTTGYATPGDRGGALYKRVTSLSASAIGFQSADGAWWELAETEINVRACGAVGDGTTDDTAAIQAAIDASAPGHTTGLVLQTRPVIIPPTPGATYKVSQLNATNIGGFALRGVGSGATYPILRSFSAVNAILDMTGSCTGFNLRDFVIYGPLSDGLEGSYPAIGLLLAVTSVGAGNYNFMENINVNGRFTEAARYVYGVSDAKASMCNAVNVNQNDPNTYGVVYTANNVSGVTSAFATIGTGDQGISDWLHERCEHHAFTSAGGQSPKAILLENTTNMTWNNGNIAAAGQGFIVELVGTNAHANFDNVTFYTDQGPDSFTAIGSVDPSGTMSHLVMTNCYVQVAATGSLYSVSSGIISGTAIGLTLQQIGGSTVQYDIAGLGTSSAINGSHI